MRKLWSSIVGVIAVAAILLGINLLTDRFLPDAQLDLTQARLYTLAPGTRRILARLKQPITLRLFYSQALGAASPAYGAYADRVRAMLRQYASLSHGNIHLAFLDPEPFSNTEDRAMAAGLQGVPLNTSGEQVYFGLAGTNLLDDQRSIGFFQAERERFLEYDLTRLVYELSNPTRSVVGLMSSLPIVGDPRLMMSGRGGAPFVVMQQIEQSFTVRPVPLDVSAIDPAIQVLIVAQAQHLAPAALYAIDQFVMRGGRLLAMVDPHSETQAAQPDPNGMPQHDTSSNLAQLFDAWGIAFDPSQVVGDLDGAWRVRGGSGGRTQLVDYPPWFTISGAGIAGDDPAMADVTQVSVASAGALARKAGAAIDFTPLLSSGKNSAMIPVGAVRDQPNPAQILADFKPAGRPLVIAARVHGVLKSAFSGPPAELKPPAGAPPFRAQSDGPATLVVVGDTDLLADRFWVHVQDFFGQQEAEPFTDNGPFIANVLGTLAGGDDLIGLRGKGAGSRPFTVVDRMQHQAQAQYQKTETALQSHLDQTQKKLADLRSGKGEKSAVVTEAQRSAIDGLQQDMVQTRTRLRAVQLNLRREIDRLETALRLADIVAVPAVLVLLSMLLGLLRRRRRARV